MYNFPLEIVINDNKRIFKKYQKISSYKGEI